MKKLFLIAFFVFCSVTSGATELNFGSIEFVTGGGNLNATMNPINGSITCNNSANYTCESFGTVGTITIAGAWRSSVDIACRSTAKISNGNFTFNVSRSEIVVNGRKKIRCRGLNQAVLSHIIKRNPTQNELSWAGRLKVRGTGNADISGVYTSNGGAGARPQTIRVIFQ